MARRCFSSTTEDDVLNWVFGTTGYTPHPSNLVLRLSTALPLGSGVSPVSGGSYADQAITLGASSGGQVANTNTITFPTATAPWGKIIAWDVRDTIAGVTLACGYLGVPSDRVYALYGPTGGFPNFMEVQSAAAPATDTRFFLVSTFAGGTGLGAPSVAGASAIEDGVEYWSVNQTGDRCQLALTRGGAPLTLVDQSLGVSYLAALVWTSKTVTVNTGDQIVFAPGAITVALS